jgi:NAD(P)-dependent dehydrogenase (short-subunit alcohol dehydrogenase family)
MDVLANCAGMVVLAPAEDLTSQIWDTTLAVNLTGTFLMSQQVGRAMLEAGGGKIINSISRVLPGCSSSPNRANLPPSSSRNRSASCRCSNPTMKSSANLMMITSPCAWRFLHQSAHRSRT